MLIYIICFILSTFLIYIAEINKKNKLIYFFTTATALLIPCFLAGMRDITIGTDVKVYVNHIFECAQNAESFSMFQNMGWSIIWKYEYVHNFELGFTVLVYFATKIFSSLSSVLFFIQLFMILPIYFGIKKFPNSNKFIWLGMLVYYFIFYCMGLNLMRQMISIAICFYAVSILLNEEKKDFKFLIYTFIATLFHKSSILVLIVYLMYRFIINDKILKLKLTYNNKKIKLVNLLIILIVAMSVILIFNNELLINLLTFLDLNEYSGYIYGKSTISYLQIGLRIPVIIFLIFNMNKKTKSDKINYLLLIIALIDLVMSNLSSASAYAIRISLLFQFFSIISLPLLCYKKLENKKKFRTNVLYVTFYSILYWYIIYVSYGVGEVIPYKF